MNFDRLVLSLIVLGIGVISRPTVAKAEILDQKLKETVPNYASETLNQTEVDRQNQVMVEKIASSQTSLDGKENVINHIQDIPSSSNPLLRVNRPSAPEIISVDRYSRTLAQGTAKDLDIRGEQPSNINESVNANGLQINDNSNFAQRQEPFNSQEANKNKNYDFFFWEESATNSTDVLSKVAAIDTFNQTTTEAPNQLIAQDPAPTETTPTETAPNNETTPNNETEPNQNNQNPESTSYSLRGDIIRSRSPQLTTAHQLKKDEILPIFRFRQPLRRGSGAEQGLTGQPTFGISWGITDNLELTVDAQTQDNSGPGRQGAFTARRLNQFAKGPNYFQELTFQLKQRIFENAEGTQALSGVIAVSTGSAQRPMTFSSPTTSNVSVNNGQTVISLEFPYTFITSDRLQFTLSPKVAFLPEDNALYFARPPVANPGSFGTTIGLAGGVSYSINPRLILWGDAFFPFTGNNSINRDTGLPAKTLAFNTGLRYIVNPRLGLDLFLSNAVGNTGALSMIADRLSTSVGVGLTFIPGLTSANRSYPQSFFPTAANAPSKIAGFGFLDGGTVSNQELLTTVRGGSQGILAAVRYGVVKDFEFGIFLDNISGVVDESEFGFSGKVRFLHQADGDPFTLSGLATIARANNVLVNLINRDRNNFTRRGLSKGGFAFTDEREGELFIITLAAPMHYQFRNGSAVWFTPTLGYIQRENGLDIAGFNLGGSIPVSQDLRIIAEAGLDFASKGNVLTNNGREKAIPWSLGVRWNPSSFFGEATTSDPNDGLQLEAYITNRVGSSPFHTLRVRDNNSIGVGVGLIFPVRL